MVVVPVFVSGVIVIDDKCPQESGKYIELMQIDRVTALYHLNSRNPSKFSVNLIQ